MRSRGGAVVAEEAALRRDGSVVAPEEWKALLGLSLDPHVTLSSPNAALLSSYARARANAAAVWPEAAAELEELVVTLAWFSSGKRQNFSDPKTFGVIFMNTDRHDEPWQLAEDLVHEAAHHSLFVETSVGPLLAEPKKLVWSPIRKEERPAIGVYHGAFAQGRILELARRARDSGVAGAAEAAARMEREHRDNQRTALSELRKLGLTEKGERCVAEMEAALEAFARA